MRTYNSYYSPEASRYYPYDQRTGTRASASALAESRGARGLGPIQFRIRYCLAIAYSGRDAPRLRRALERNVPRPGHASPGGAGDRTRRISARVSRVSGRDAVPATRIG